MVKNKIGKLNKKKAMSLVALLFSLALLSIIVGMFIPVLTKGYIQITTGKGGLGKINLTTSSGYFMCYYEANGVLTQARADISHTGEIKLVKEAAPSGVCKFVIPNRADSFKITLIGGGGGGAASQIKTLDQTLATASLGGSSTKFSIPSFSDWTSYISESRINSALAALFSNNTNSSNTYLCIKGNKGSNLGAANGANGANCMVRFNLMPKINSSFTFGTEASTNSTVYANSYYVLYEGSKAMARGGANAVAINGTNSSPEQYITSCCVGSALGCPSAFNVLCNKINNDSTGVGECQYSGSNLSVAKGGYCTSGTQSINFANGTKVYSTALSGTVKLYLKRREIVKYTAGKGEAGAVETRSVSFISPNSGTDTFNIPSQWLGTGGIGGKQAGNTSYSGTAGGATKMELSTAGDESLLVLTAEGGAGGVSQEDAQHISVGTFANPDTTIDSIPAGTISGADGGYTADIIPQPLRITMLSTGFGVVDCKNTTCDVTAAATYPGAGGGAAGAYYSGYNNGASPRITFNYGTSLTNYVLASANNSSSGVSAPASPTLKSGKGGNGARGAILISW